MLTHYIKKQKPKATKVFDTYWHFASERQNIFFNRMTNEFPFWTNDVILRNYKFTNAYRASDRASQFLIKHVIYKGDQSQTEILFRILLFKLFNKIETWNWLQNSIGELKWSEFNFQQYNQVLTEARAFKKKIYSGAYIMASGKSAFGYEFKHENHLKLLEVMMKEGLTSKIAQMDSMSQVFELLKSYPSIGDFLAYQYTTDINYSEVTNFSEMDFVVPGPGAKDGMRKCFHDFGDYSGSDIIRMICEEQEQHFETRDIQFKTLWGRSLQLIDCQNLFCEVDKYARVAHPDILGISQRVRIKQKFQPNKNLIKDYWFPPKWGINKSIKNENHEQNA